MSQFLARSPQHCAKKGFSLDLNLNKKLIYSISTFILSILSFIFLLWLILHPAKPQFSLKEANINQLNFTEPYLLNSSIQVTFETKNPNQKVGIYYDQLQTYASYKGQQITLDTHIPSFYQGLQESNLISASLIGGGVPVASSIGYNVGRDKVAGNVVLSLKVDGQVRWRIGTWVSGRYRIDVNCIAVLPFGGQVTPASSVGTNKQKTQCSTTM
ncbi:hypothetical protein Droror1_Dr00009398 [Drosera rotundifolia]